MGKDSTAGGCGLEWEKKVMSLNFYETISDNLRQFPFYSRIGCTTPEDVVARPILQCKDLTCIYPIIRSWGDTELN